MSILEADVSKAFCSDKEEPPSKTTVIVHGRCTDGFCSAWVARKVFPNAKFVYTQFGDSPPDVKGQEVYIIDFSYRRQILQNMHEQARSLRVLDHHITAEKELLGLPYCRFDMRRSGAGMAWQQFSNSDGSRNLDEPMPWVVNYVQDRDLWKNELPESRAVNAVISSYPFNFDMWDELAHRTLDDVKKEGRSILRFQEQMASDMIRYAREVVLDGYHILAVNTSIMNSDVGNMLAKGRPFGIVWYQREDGKHVYSLRSNERGVDVSQIALKHGGGGHKCSAGFTTDKQIL